MQWLAEICVKRPVFATMLIVSLMVVGIFSYFSLGVDRYPNIDFPTVTITVVNPGASPVEIETEITKKIEEVVNSVSGIDELRSTSLEGVSQVFVQFVLEKDVNIASQEIDNKIQTVISDLPDTAETPFVQKLDSGATPVLRVTLSADANLRDITQIAEDEIKEKLESISGVGQISMVGLREREIQVWVNPDKMRAFGVTIGEVTNAVGSQNMELPAGRIDQGRQESTIRTLGKLTDPEQFNHIVVADRGGYSVKVKDIGYVEDGVKEPRGEARLNGKPAVTLVISKQSGTNSVTVAEELKERIREIEHSLPKGYDLQIVGDQSVFIEASLESIKEHLIVGSILATIVIFLFLWNFRSTLIAAIAIPTSIVSTFGLMLAMGYTLNSITMLSLTLMVGIVVDDAIVVLENIFHFIEEKGMSPYRAAIEGTREIGLAVLATTLSLLAVFVPVGFMGGIVGRFMSSFGLTSAFAILISMIVSFSLTPMLAARIIKWKKPEEKAGRLTPMLIGILFGGRKSEEESTEGAMDSELIPEGETATDLDEPADQAVAREESTKELIEENKAKQETLVSPSVSAIDLTIQPSLKEKAKEQVKEAEEKRKQATSRDSWFYSIIDSTYTKMLKFSMAHRWVIALLCLLTVLSIYPLGANVGINFLPVDDQSEYEVTVRAPEGYTLAASSVLVEKVASDIRKKFPEVTHTLVTLGGGAQEIVNSGSIYVRITPIEDRAKSQQELMIETREMIQNSSYVKDLKIGVQQVSEFSGGGQSNSDFQYVISGPDLDKLQEISVALVEKIKQVPDAVDVDSSYVGGKPEFRLEIDRDKAADLGVRVRDIAQGLNSLVTGQEVSTFTVGDNQYDVRVRAIGDFRSNEDKLKRLVVPSSKLGQTTLDNVVKVTEGIGPASINRRNRQRQVSITANVRPGGSQVAISRALENGLKEMNLSEEYQAGAIGQSKELQKSAFYFLIAISLAFIFMYIVLAAQFESFIHPITILMTLPLAIPFGILAVLVAGQTLNIFSMLGILLLFGVVKKNAILVIDHTNQLRERGMSRYDAIIQGNRDRLRPILMTTIALVAGMMPLVWSSGPGAGTNRSVGVLVVGGQSLCLLLTLLAVPVFYSYFDDLSNLNFLKGMTKGMQVTRQKTVKTVSSLIGLITKN